MKVTQERVIIGAHGAGWTNREKKENNGGGRTI